MLHWNYWEQSRSKTFHIANMWRDYDYRVLLLQQMFFDGAHRSGSVNLVPTAEDKAGLCIIHPEKMAQREQGITRGHKLVTAMV